MQAPLKRHSKKRDGIREVIKNTKTHPDAEWIYAKLKPDFPDLSLATVYRNLNEMKKSGEIQTVAYFNGKERYDGDVSSHTHFICDCCGKIEDLWNIDHDEAVDAKAQENFDGKINSHSLIFHGLCSECVNSKAQKN